jgi:hypothetical protein
MFCYNGVGAASHFEVSAVLAIPEKYGLPFWTFHVLIGLRVTRLQNQTFTLILRFLQVLIQDPSQKSEYRRIIDGPRKQCFRNHGGGNCYYLFWGYAVVQFFEALHYSQEGRGFESRLIGIFHWLKPFGRIMALGLTLPLTDMCARNISGGEGGG